MGDLRLEKLDQSVDKRSYLKKFASRPDISRPSLDVFPLGLPFPVL